MRISVTDGLRSQSCIYSVEDTGASMMESAHAVHIVEEVVEGKYRNFDLKSINFLKLRSVDGQYLSNILDVELWFNHLNDGYNV